MATSSALKESQIKTRIMYGGMVLAGAVFVSTLVLPVPDPVARIIAAIAFGVMSGLWLGQLVYSQ